MTVQIKIIRRSVNINKGPRGKGDGRKREGEGKRMSDKAEENYSPLECKFIEMNSDAM